MVDNFGNKIEYDVNGWVGEDNPSNSRLDIANTSKNAINTNTSIGNLYLNISNINSLDNKSTLLLTLMNDKLETLDFFLYAKNDFKDSIELKSGKYEVVSLIDLSNNKQYSLSENKFEINNNNVNLDIVEEKKENVVSITEENIKENKKDKNKGVFTNIIINLLLFLLLIFIAFFFIYKKFNKNNE